MKKATLDLIEMAYERIMEETKARIMEWLKSDIDKLFVVPIAPVVEESDTEMTIDDVCRFLGTTKPTIYRLTCQRKIPHYRKGKKLLFDKSEILKWDNEKKRKVKTKAEIEEEAATYCAIGRSNARSIKRAI